MKFEELKSSLKDKIFNAYVISGSDAYLRDSAQKQITNKCVSVLPDFNVNIFNDENFDVDKILECANSVPMMDEKRVVVIADVSLQPSHTKKLQEYLKNPNESCCMIFKSEKFENKQILALCELVDCNVLSEKLLTQTVMQKINKNDVKIENTALKILLEYCNFDLMNIDNEIKKLCAYVNRGGTIKEKDVKELVHKHLEYSVFELNNFIVQKNAEKSFELLDALIAGKESPQNILVVLLSSFRRMFFSVTNKGTNKEIADMLGVKEYSIVVTKRLAQKFTPKKLKQILDLGSEIDHKIKLSQMNDKDALYFFVANIIS